jgi:NitT/TauT family transport system ATP-binding protein
LPTFLSLTHVRKEFVVVDRRIVTALDDISIDVREREFLAVVGPSGCGKTTLLRIIAGLVPATGGDVALNGRAIAGPPAEIVYIAQQYSKSLFPWRTVLANAEFPLEHRHDVTRAGRTARALQALANVGLADVVDRYPWQLSGGMQQRVAIARALVARPSVLLLDEPFSSVDALTRMELQDLMLEAWREHALTVVLVTHDVEEAVYLSDRVAVMTGQPARIDETIAVDLPRPREQLATRSTPRFLALRDRLYGLVRRHPEMAQR